MSNALSRCDIYVQLLGGLPGKKAPGGEAGIVRRQFEVAVKSEKPRHVWMRSDFDIAECDQNHAAFLNGIALGSHRGSFVEFKDYLLKKLRDVAKQEESDQRRLQRIRNSSRKPAKHCRRSESTPRSRTTNSLRSSATLSGSMSMSICSIMRSTVPRWRLRWRTTMRSCSRMARARKDGSARRPISGSLPAENADAKAKRFQLAVGNGAPPGSPSCPRGPDVQIISIADKVDTAAMLEFLGRLGVAASQTEAAR